MRAVVCRAWMPYRELPLEDVAAPPMRPGCVRIGTHAACKKVLASRDFRVKCEELSAPGW